MAATTATTFIIGERLPWPDESPAAHLAGDFEAVPVLWSGRRSMCAIRKISALGATVSADLATSPGEQVALELGTGRRSGALAWVRAGQAGIAFDQPLDVLGLINRSLVSQPAERRQMPRVEIRHPAFVRFRGRPEPVTLCNISAAGLQIEGDELPARGTLVTVLVEGLVMPAGEVMWQKGRLAGIELFEELSWTSIVPWIREAIRRGLN